MAIAVRLTIVGRPIGRKEPNFRRSGKPYPNAAWQNWKETANDQARLQVNTMPAEVKNVLPWCGPVELQTEHFVAKRRGNVPDATNLLKGIEDILQGILYENDTQVAFNSSLRVVVGSAGEEKTVIRATLL